MAGEAPRILNIENDVADTATKWAIKYLAANKGSTEQLADLQFNNLVIGKKYQLLGCVQQMSANGAATFMISSELAAAGTPYHRSYLSSSDATHPNDQTQLAQGINTYFTAASTTMYCHWASTSTYKTCYGDGTVKATHVILRELPANYIETTDFD